MKGWNHFALGMGTSTVPQGFNQPDVSLKSIESVRERGGVVAVASTVLADGGRDALDDALFQPWPCAGLLMRRRIAEVLTIGRRRYAEGLWKSALDESTYDHTRTYMLMKFGSGLFLD